MVLAAVATLFSVATAPTPSFAAVNVKDKAPPLVVTDMAGVKVDLGAMKGKTVIVSLWASWCEPCREEIPMLRDFYHKYQDKGVEIIALSLDRPHDKKAVEKVAAEVDYHVAMSADASANGFNAPESLPVTYVINGDGDVSAVFDQGPVTEAELKKALSR